MRSNLRSSTCAPLRCAALFAFVLGCMHEGAPLQTPAPAAQPSLRAGTSADYAPFSEAYADGYRGFAIALLEEYARDRSLKLEWQPFQWSEIVSNVRSGAFDVFASGVTVRPERSMVGRYSVPITATGTVLLLRRPDWLPPEKPGVATPASALDSARMRIGVNRGGHLERTARRLFPVAVIMTTDNNKVPELLRSGQVDAVLTNNIEAPVWAKQLGNVEQLGPLTQDNVALYMPADSITLARDLDDYLFAAEASGELGRLRQTWLGGIATEPTSAPLQALLAATAERLSLMPWAAAAKLKTGKPITDAAQEARVLQDALAGAHEEGARIHATPPDDALLLAFFRAQIEAAKVVQHSVPAGSEAPYDLERDLRPAMARISERMHRILLRLPAQLPCADVRTAARAQLAALPVDEAHVMAIADTICDLSKGQVSPPASVAPVKPVSPPISAAP